MRLYIQRKKLRGVADTIIKQLLCPQMETLWNGRWNALAKVEVKNERS